MGSNLFFFVEGMSETNFLVINNLFVLGHPFVRGQFLGSMSEGSSFSAQKSDKEHVSGQFLYTMSVGSSIAACQRAVTERGCYSGEIVIVEGIGVKFVFFVEGMSKTNFW